MAWTKIATLRSESLPYNDPASNVLTDFSFDNWAAGSPTTWSTFWKGGSSTPTVIQGTLTDALDVNAVKVTFNAAASFQRLTELVFTVSGGQVWDISVWVKGTGTTPQIAIDVLTNAAGGNPDYFASGVQDVSALAATTVTGTWTLYQGSVKIASTQAVARLSLSLLGGSGDTVWVDRVTVRVAEVPTTFNGVPAGGASGTVLTKASATDYDTGWVAPSPTGMISMFGGAAAPTGWLLCDGSSQLRASYAALFAVIGTTYGSVDGTHFTLPSMASKFPRGNTPGAGAGADTHQHAAGTFAAASHSHSISSHHHGLSDAGQAQISGSSTVVGGRNVGGTTYTQSFRSGTTAGSATSTGNGVGLMGQTDDTGTPIGNTAPAVSGTSAAGDNVPAYTGVAFIIKT